MADMPNIDAVAGISSKSVGVAISRSDVRLSGAGEPSKTTRPVAFAPRVPVTTRPVMSSPVTVTFATANSRSTVCGAGAFEGESPPISAIASEAALIRAAIDCTCNE
jgi:hypothetical protein